jgi:hypothetical protein
MPYLVGLLLVNDALWKRRVNGGSSFFNWFSTSAERAASFLERYLLEFPMDINPDTNIYPQTKNLPPHLG